jgi:GT2 family glycosyltransferase
VDVSVVVPSSGVPPTLDALLSALSAQTLPRDRFEVLLVEKGASGDRRTFDELAQRWEGPGLRLLWGPKDGGPGAQRNRGAAEARGELIAFTDADCEPDPGWLEAGLDAARRGAEVVQGPTLPPEGADIPPFAHHHALESETCLYEACNMFYKRSLLERLGGFSTSYFSRVREPFGEDTELGWRAQRAGARFQFEPKAVVRHAVTPRTAGQLVLYQWRGRAFPLLVRDVPELRRAFLHRRYFLSRRSERFAAAIAGLALARRIPLAAALALPYARLVLADARRTRRRGRVRHVSLALASDAVLLAGLVWGSARWRRPVL